MVHHKYYAHWAYNFVVVYLYNMRDSKSEWVVVIRILNDRLCGMYGSKFLESKQELTKPKEKTIVKWSKKQILTKSPFYPNQ